MKLSDGTIIATSIKFLGPMRRVFDRQDRVIGAYFIFNAHKLYYNTEEEASGIRAEIEEKVPEATLVEFGKSNVPEEFTKPPEE